MGASPDELVEDIERHRAELGATIGEIERRVRPGRMLRAVRWQVIGGLALTAGLLGWLIGRRGAGRRGPGRRGPGRRG